MSWVAVAIGGSALLGAGSSLMASDKQAKAGAGSLKLQGDIYNQNKMQLDPFINQGYQANFALGDLLGLRGINTHAGTLAGAGHQDTNAALVAPFTLDKFQQSPGYQFNLQQGQMAIDKGANARGNYYAPQTLQDISRFSQGLASNEFNNERNAYWQQQNNVFNKLSQQGQMGLSGANALAGVGSNYAANAGNTMAGIGNTQAAGIMGAGNAIQGGISDYFNQYMQAQMLKQLQTPTYGMGAGGNFSYAG